MSINLFFFFSNLRSTKKQEQDIRILIPTENLTLLHIAAFYDSFEVFVYLESLGFSLKTPSAAQYYPIHYACANGSLEVCSYILMKEPFEARMLPDVEYHLIYLATTAGNCQILKLLFSCGADINADKNKNNKPVQQAIRTRNVECLKLLLPKITRTDLDTREYTSIMLAITNNQPDAVPLLLEAGEDPGKFTSQKVLFLIYRVYFLYL